MAKLLIVEDDLLLDEAYRRKYLGKYDVRIVSDGVSGIDAANSWEPDLILLDLYLPGEFDGIEVLKRLKKEPKTAKIPVLVVTNLPDAVDKVMQLGAEKCFMKTDVDLDEIEEMLDALLRKRENRK
jgi:DNA-binding response OmpR family regulator